MTMDDVVERAKSAHALVIGPENTWAVRGCTEMYAVIPELVAELEKARRAAKTLGKIVDDSLMDVLKATDSQDLVGEDGDGDWMLIFERLAELRPSRDAALAELESARKQVKALVDIVEHTGNDGKVPWSYIVAAWNVLGQPQGGLS